MKNYINNALIVLSVMCASHLYSKGLIDSEDKLIITMKGNIEHSEDLYCYHASERGIEDLQSSIHRTVTFADFRDHGVAIPPDTVLDLRIKYKNWVMRVPSLNAQEVRNQTVQRWVYLARMIHENIRAQNNQ